MGNERFAHKKVKKNWNIAHERWKTRLYETNSRSWGNSLKKRATKTDNLKRQEKWIEATTKGADPEKMRISIPKTGLNQHDFMRNNGEIAEKRGKRRNSEIQPTEHF
jgi:hypothetical protein